jgi:hypothetical protein
MKMTVKKDKLVKIIKREFPFYTEEQIKETIDEYGAEYFNGYGSTLSIKYLGFAQWEITKED